MSYGHWQGVERVTHSQTDTLQFIQWILLDLRVQRKINNLQEKITLIIHLIASGKRE